MSVLLKLHRQLMKTPFRRFVEKNLAYPRGLGGAYVATIMNQVNVGITKFTLQVLKLEAGQEVLEIGFGGGVSFDLVLPEIQGGCMYGLDMSADMLSRSEKNREREIKAGLLKLSLGTVDRQPYLDNQMDRAFSVNTIYFWPDPRAGLKELYRILKPGGRLVLGLRSKSFRDQNGYSDKIFKNYSDEEFRDFFESVGFRHFEIIRTELAKVETLAVLGVK
jgi:arsenite methyltransferase